MNRALKRIRAEKGYSLRRLAQESGIGTSTIGNYETCRTEMSDESLKRIADCLKTPVHELAKKENEDAAADSAIVREDAPVYGQNHWKRLYLRLPDEMLENAVKDLLTYKSRSALDDAREILDELKRRREQNQSQEHNP